MARTKPRPATRKQPAIAGLKRKARKRALCVGINDYPYDGNDLNGCVNDAKAWATLLVDHFDFPRDDVRVLLDKKATKKATMAALKDLLAGARSGDVLVFTNSSHGSYKADKDRDEERYDELLCPYDIDRNDISDDELWALFSAVPEGVRLSVVLDNCHSGTATRAAVGDILPGMRTPDDRRVRFLNPALRGLPVLENPWKARPRRVIKRPESKMREVLLAGCTDKEYSYDAMIDGTYHGALTCYALRAIRKAQYDLTWAQLHQQVLHLIEDYPQHPQLEGRRDAKRRPIFR
jgi:metacaspase-1